MAQATDAVLDNQPPASLRAELNQILMAIVTGHSGPSAPSVTYGGMPWTNTSTTPPSMMVRNSSNSAWIPDGLADTTNRGYVSATSPTLTGTVIVPTVVASNNSTQAASTAHVKSAITNHGGWFTPTLAGGWSVVGGSTIAYRKDADGMVSIRGLVTKTNVLNSDNVLVLPAGFTPIYDINRYGYVADANSRMVINSGGTVTVLSGAIPGTTFLILDVKFPTT